MVGRWAKAAFIAGLEDVKGGTLTLKMADGARHFGMLSDLDATLAIHDDRFFLRAIAGGDIGIGESFMDGEWSSPDLVALIRIACRNLGSLDAPDQLTPTYELWTVRRESWLPPFPLMRHYERDRGNDFFRLFLDRELLMLVRLLRDRRRIARSRADRQGRSHLPPPGAVTRRSCARDRIRLGRIRRSGGDATAAT
jgi:hypothetical protein